MDSDLNTQLVASRTGGGVGSVQTAVLKKTNEMEASVATLVAEAVTAAPPLPGQGLQVDKHA